MRALALALLLAAPAAAAQEASGERAATIAAAERGRLLFAYDRAAWVGTDAMFAKVADPAGKLGGYVVEGPAEAPRVTFYDKAAEPRAVFVARFSGGKLADGKVLGQDDDRALSPEALRRVHALATARAALAKGGARPCAAKPFNAIVLPANGAGEPLRVYFLTPQSDNDHLPFGGHYEVDVAPDGTAGQPRPFTKTCLEMPVKAPGPGQPVGITVSHLLDPVPTEIHVFSSLALGKPVFVATIRPTPRLWVVDGGRITGPRPLAPPAK